MPTGITSTGGRNNVDNFLAKKGECQQGGGNKIDKP